VLRQVVAEEIVTPVNPKVVASREVAEVAATRPLDVARITHLVDACQVGVVDSSQLEDRAEDREICPK